MKIFDLKHKQEYLKEVMELEFKEWSSASISEIDEKVKKINSNESFGRCRLFLCG